MRLKETNGAALLTVLVAMMIITIMLFEFQYSSMVERKLAYNDLNQLQAYYLAKSGVRIGILRVELYGRARKSKDIQQVAQGADIKPYLELIWNLPMPAFPPAKSLVTKLDKSDKDAAEKVLEQTKVEDGSVTHTITSESAKINLNFLRVPPDRQGQNIDFSASAKSLDQLIAKTLANLIAGFIQASDDPFKEYGNLKPEEVVMDIMDWINPGDTRFAGGAKDQYYEGLVPPYKAKRQPFFTVDELRLVRGIDEHLFTKLKPYVTVYSSEGRININSAADDVIRALYRDFTDDDLKKIAQEKNRLHGWPSESAFVDFIGNTLGRSGFKTLYSDAKNYPFTVASQSFLVKSVATLERSKSKIEKMIRVNVALTTGGVTAVPGYTTLADCQKQPGLFWDTRVNACYTTPTSQKDCVDIGAGWIDNPNTTAGGKCCAVPNFFTACPNTNPNQPPPNPGHSRSSPGRSIRA